MVFGGGGERGPESSQTEYKGRTKEKIDCQETANAMRGEGERSHNNINNLSQEPMGSCLSLRH